MASSNVGHQYDEDLLNAAPRPDKRQLQEGYDADILATPGPPNASKKRSTDPHEVAGRSSSTPTRDLEREQTTPQGARSKSSLGAPTGPSTGGANGTSASNSNGAARADTTKRASRTVRHAPAPTPSKKQPFYKTRKGLVIIAAVLIAIIVAAVVGGVVGSRKSSPAQAEGTSAPVPGTGSGQDQGVGAPPEATQTNAPDSPPAEAPGGTGGGDQGQGVPGAPETDQGGGQFEGVPPLRRRWIKRDI